MQVAKLVHSLTLMQLFVVIFEVKIVMAKIVVLF